MRTRENACVVKIVTKCVKGAKLPLSFGIVPYRAVRYIEVELHAFYRLELDGGEWSA
jgi:hypothetical protein